ncbi:MAG: hypothetical protein ABIP31_12630 [Chitinophagaceae bacterium]
MKPLLFCLSLILCQNKGNAQGVIYYDQFSTIFQKYEKQYKEMIVHVISGNLATYSHYRIIGRKKKKWYIIDYFKNKSSFYPDSVIKRQQCLNCDSIYRVIEENNLLNLKKEEEIKEPCIRRTESTSISLDDNEHVPYHIIELKIKGHKKKLVYRDPRYALEICPQSKERQRFLNVIWAIATAERE